MESATAGGFDRLEIGVAGPYARAAERDLAEQLRGVRGLHVQEGAATTYDALTALAVAGSVAGIIQGIDVLWRWFSSGRESGQAVRVTLRTRSGGHLELSTQSVDEARQLLEQLKRSLGDSTGTGGGPAKPA